MSQAYIAFRHNRSDIISLMSIHEKVGGVKQGRRYGLEVLNKSAVVLITACWEAFIEDLCTEAFDHLLSKCNDHSEFPASVRILVSKQLKKDPDDRVIWGLAGDGWKSVLLNYRHEIIKKYVGKLNTPKSEQVINIFNETIGIKDITKNWYWRKCSIEMAKTKLNNYIMIRGAIAHRTTYEEPITKT